MKKFLSALLALFLFIGLVVPAFAAEPYDAAWVPPIPDFITPVENGYKITCKIDAPFDKYPDITDFENNEAKEFIVLLDQGVYNRYKEENNIPYDRQFSIYVVTPRKKPDGTYYDFGVFEHKGGPRHQEQMNTPGPMTYMCLNNPHAFFKYIYDENTDTLVLQPALSILPGGSGSFLRFTYVLAAGGDDEILQGIAHIVNGKFSEPSKIYPGFSQVSGKDFGVGTVYHQFIDGKAVEHWRDYDWWLGIKGEEEIPPYNENFDINLDTDGDGEPDLNIDTDGDGKPDVNIDTNGDRKPDLNIDTDGNGKPDINIDLDGDGSPDINIDLNGDGKPDLNIDTDGDKKPDVNVDIDGDGKPDVNVKPGDGSGSGEGSSGGGSSTGGSSSGGSSGGGSSEGEGPGSGEGGSGSGGDGPGSSGGSSSDKGSGSPDTWFGESDNKPSYDPWEFFDPFKSDYTPAPWDKNYSPTKPGDSIYDGYDPFAVFNNLLKEMFGG